MRFFLISILCFLVVSCATYPKKQHFRKTSLSKTSLHNLYFSETKRDYVYKASINAFGNSFDGLFIVKKTSTSQHRIVFTTPMGNKLFDFSFQKNSMETNFIIKELDKKPLLTSIEKDFYALLNETVCPSKKYKTETTEIFQVTDAEKYFYTYNNSELTQITRVKHQKEIAKLTFSEINDNIAKKINISYPRKNLNIHLTLTP